MIITGTVRLSTTDVPPPGQFRNVDERAETNVPKPGQHQQGDQGASVVTDEGRVYTVPQTAWMKHGMKVKLYYAEDGLRVEQL
jgi:hypothetical protein